MTTEPAAASLGDGPRRVPADRASSAAADRAEPRALRTRSRVLDAVRAAAEDGALGELTVASLCRAADVHRVTFYKHWVSLGDAVTDAFTELVDSLAAVSDGAIAEAEGPQELAALYSAALSDQLGELLAHRATYRELLSPGGPYSFRDALEASLRDRALLALAALARTGVPVGDPATAASYLAGGAAASFAAFALGDSDDVATAAARITDQLPVWWPAAATPRES